MTRNELILANLDWAAGLARGVYYARRREHPGSRLGEVEDCISIAHLELAKRAALYDSTLNDNFRGYAAISIKGAVKMHFRALLRSPNHDPYHVEVTGGDSQEWDILTEHPEVIPVANPAQRQMQVAVGALPLLLRIVAYRHFLCSEPLWKLQEQLRLPKTQLQRARKEVMAQLKVALDG